MSRSDFPKSIMIIKIISTTSIIITMIIIIITIASCDGSEMGEDDLEALSPELRSKSGACPSTRLDGILFLSNNMVEVCWWRTLQNRKIPTSLTSQISPGSVWNHSQEGQAVSPYKTRSLIDKSYLYIAKLCQSIFQRQIALYSRVSSGH